MKRKQEYTSNSIVPVGQTAEGRVVGCLGGRYEVLTAAGERVFCGARGSFRRDEGRVLVGDLVTVTPQADGSAVISGVGKRKNSLIRPLLANLDLLVIVVAKKEPTPLPDLVDKLLAIAEHERMQAAVVLSKDDLEATEDAAAFPVHAYRLAGYPVFSLSSRTGAGVDVFGAWLKERLAEGMTVSFAGASGVGKSTLLNALFPALERETGKVSDKNSRGRHTTRSVSLFPLGGGFVADTPGFSLLDFLRFDFFTLDDLPHVFPEIDALVGSCRYADCSHTKEEECGVKEAVRAGRMAASRYASYLALYEVLAQKEKDAYK